MNLMTAASILLGALQGGPDLTPEEFTKAHAALLAPEKWSTIPWKASLIEARATAFSEKRPLFVWAMDGKPLGSV